MKAKADTYNDETRVKHTVMKGIVDVVLDGLMIDVVGAGGGRG